MGGRVERLLPAGRQLHPQRSLEPARQSDDVLLCDARAYRRSIRALPRSAQESRRLLLAGDPRGRGCRALARHQHVSLQDVRGRHIRRDDRRRRRVLRVLLQQSVSRAGVSHFALDRADPGTDHRRHRYLVRPAHRRISADRPVREHAGNLDRARPRRTRRQAGLLRTLPARGRDGAAGWRVAVARPQARRDGAPIMTALLSIDAVSKRFRVAQGSIFAVIGPNGAGKTTLFNLIAGMSAPDRGSIAFAGERIDGLTPDQICRRGIGRTFQLVRPFPALSVEDNVAIGAMLHRHDPALARRRAHEVLGQLDLFDKRHQPASALTLPDRKRLEVARALATDPKLLLLDEVMAGLRPAETDHMVSVLTELNREAGLTILLIEHVMRAVMALAARVLVLHHGAAIAEGAPEAVVREPAVVQSYLGAEAVD